MSWRSLVMSRAVPSCTTQYVLIYNQHTSEHGLMWGYIQSDGTSLEHWSRDVKMNDANRMLIVHRCFHMGKECLASLPKPRKRRTADPDALHNDPYDEAYEVVDNSATPRASQPTKHTTPQTAPSTSNGTGSSGKQFARGLGIEWVGWQPLASYTVTNLT